MSGPFLTGPPREANQGGKERDFSPCRPAAWLNSPSSFTEKTEQTE